VNKRGVGAALAGLALALAALVPAAGATAAAANEQAPEPDAALLMERYGLSHEQARQRLRVQEALSNASERIRKDVGAPFAGLEYSASDGAAVVLVTRPGAAARAQTPPGQEKREVVVPRSADELASLAERALQSLFLSAEPADTLGVSTHTSAREGRLIIELDSRATAEAQRRAEEFQRQEGDAVAVRSVAQTLSPAACSTQRCDPPARGGVAIHPRGIQTTPYCSSGFVVNSTTDGKPYLLTAAHCQNGIPLNTVWGQTFESDGISHAIGARWNGQYSGNVDAQILSFDNPTGWQATKNWVLAMERRDDNFKILSAYNASSPVEGIYEFSQLVRGLTLCKTGWRTSTTCGQVTGDYWTVSDGQGHTVSGQVVIDACILGGDSGGAVWSPSARRAAGIVEAHNNTPCGPSGSGIGAFSPISAIQTALNVRVRTVAS
jgi:hypothetical protein